jgi:hypothetical protein
MLRIVFTASAARSRHLINLLNGLCLREEGGLLTPSCEEGGDEMGRPGRVGMGEGGGLVTKASLPV